MRSDQKIVTRIPLTELWDASGKLTDERVRDLDTSSITELLRAGPVQFVVADCGLKLRWIPTPQRFDFWKRARPQIADPGKPIYLKQFPNETAYSASEWRGRTGECLVLLEKHH
jgi:hypothetical protein